MLAKLSNILDGCNILYPLSDYCGLVHFVWIMYQVVIDREAAIQFLK